MSVNMQNPFEQSSCEPSADEFDSSMPICFCNSSSSQYHNASETSPICMIDLDRLSQKLSRTQTPETQLRSNMKQLQLLLKQMKTYTQSLEQRNLDIVMQLQKQRMRSQQLQNALQFLKGVQQKKEQIAEQRSVQLTDLSAKYTGITNKTHILEGEIKTLKLENGYLKDLILIANENYEKLEKQNREILDKNQSLQEQKGKRQSEMAMKMQEIKSMFAAIVLEKSQPQKSDKVQKRREQLSNTTNTVTFNTSKSVKQKQSTEDAYRHIFMKTLHKRKDNKSLNQP